MSGPGLWWLMTIIAGLLTLNLLMQAYIVYLKRTQPPVGMAETLTDLASILKIVQANQNQTIVEQKDIVKQVKEIPKQTAAMVQQDVVQATSSISASGMTIPTIKPSQEGGGT